MKSSNLSNFLAGQISSGEFLNTISKETEHYALMMRKVGSSIPLYHDEDVEFSVSRKSVVKLLTEVQFGNLSNIHLAYICDCLTLAGRVNYENEELREMVFDLADPEINGGFKDLDEIATILSKIEND